jgi:hypothetical protein
MTDGREPIISPGGSGAKKHNGEPPDQKCGEDKDAEFRVLGHRIVEQRTKKR